MNRTGLILLVSVISAVVIGTAIGLGVYFGTKSSDDGVRDAPECRAMWIATVDNLDWPRSPTSEESEKKEELLAYLDLMLEMNMNAVFFQVRPHGDAMYASSIEPWSEYLTGTQGVGPDPPWDPLQFIIDEGHSRGIEIHAWFNPYRARMSSTHRSDLDETHMCKTMAEFCYTYGPDLWMDPSVPAVQDRFMEVVLDVVNRYDVDGVHIDDYFYPWPVGDEQFPDNVTFMAYQNSGGKLSQGDWRRDNVNQLVRRFYHEVKQLDPNAIVSISPFGLYMPGQERGMPDPIVGTDPYATIYADSRHWMEQGWLDMLVPQIYWHLDSPGQPFEQILEWWLQPSVNPHNKLVVAGCALYKTEPSNDWGVQELINQIDVVRNHEDEGASGSCMFSARFFRDDYKSCVQAFKGPYRQNALVPSALAYAGREEHRGVWIATLFNIDWPKSKDAAQSVNQQELVDYLDLMAELKMNALYLQVRPHGDAMYNSSYEPWCEYLTGTQGTPPQPYWDPLEVAVREGHARGIEVHAWLNPLRARKSGTRDQLAPGHMCLELPHYCYDYGSDLWMDPGIPAVHDTFFNVVEDLINRYEIDGIHIDDYFYPWPVGNEDFPDNATYTQYKDEGGQLDLADWRRENTATMIKGFYYTAKTSRESVKISISPFGLYRPGEPEGMSPPITGSDQYSQLYADPKHWLREGWLDIIIPQVYWSISSTGQPFEPVLDWWVENNPNRKLVVSGNALYKIHPEQQDWEAEEMLDQVDITRSKQKQGVEGTNMYSAQYLRDNTKGCKDVFKAYYTDAAVMPSIPHLIPDREYRALWIATVANIDWPKSSSSTPGEQQQELITYLDLMVEMKMNAVFLQIRTQGDAFYNSSIEPWSRFLTGSQGQAPEPFWDPLEFMVTEGHARGIEVHAWFNPLIAGYAGTRDDIVNTHMCKVLSQYCYDYGSYLWMDPAAEKVRDRFMDVVLDVVTRYDVDGVHIDDFFYPWPSGSEPFPDNSTYSTYQDGGGGLSLEDWRRDNINQLISRYYHEVKQLSPETIVSISPFGLYRPGDERGMPAPIVGSDPYSLLYADTRHWLEQGWMDMLVPQIYWHLASEGQPFEQILEWWLQPDVNPHGKMIVAGSALYKAYDQNDWDVGELVDQIKAVRSHERYGARGTCMFSAQYYRDDGKNCVEIFKNAYAIKANTPTIPSYLEQGDE